MRVGAGQARAVLAGRTVSTSIERLGATETEAGAQRPSERLAWITGSRPGVSVRGDAAASTRRGALTAEVGGMTTAQRNVAAGLDLVDSATQTLQTVDGILQRMRELAVAARDGDGDGVDLQAEFDELVRTLDDVAARSSAGRQALFGGSQLLQVGGGAGDTLTLSFSVLDAASLGVDALDLQAPGSTTTTTTTTSTGGTTTGPTTTEPATEAPTDPGAEPEKDADGDGIVSKDETRTFGDRKAEWRTARDAYDAWLASGGADQTTGSISGDTTTSGSSTTTTTTTTTSASAAVEALDAALGSVADRLDAVRVTEDRLRATERSLGEGSAVTGAAVGRAEEQTVAVGTDERTLTAATIAVTRNLALLEATSLLVPPTAEDDEESARELADVPATRTTDRTVRARELYLRAEALTDGLATAQDAPADDEDTASTIAA